jgi:hypothetical protein
MRHGGERNIKLRAKTKRARNAAKLQYFATHGERREKLGAL